MKIIIQFFVLLCFSIASFSQNENSIHYQSSEILSWAIYCDVERGLMNIANPDLSYASAGEPENAIGVYDGSTVSLGDGGVAVLRFEIPIRNGEGPDFAVFENSFFSPPNQTNFAFCELAFVEVSSDGENFYRFPAVSEQQTDNQINGFATVDVGLYHNLAGVNSLEYGTLFDLDELNFIDQLNIDSITHVRIIDVVGSIDPQFGSVDSNGVLINDPYPTAWESGGFDLDAVAVINQNANSIEEISSYSIKVYPNPSNDWLFIESNYHIDKVKLLNLSGQIINEVTGVNSLDISSLANGVYVLQVISGRNCFIKKIIKN